MPRRILVVEDDEKSRRLLKDVLGHHGFDVWALDNGEQALRDMPACGPEAALLDIELPGMSGFDLLQRLREATPHRHLPVIAVTASVMDHDRKKILAAGFDAFVSKPVNIAELLATLNTLLSRAET